MDTRHGHRFEASGDFLERLEGPERLHAIPPEDIVQRMGLTRKDSVVDLGAGVGYFTFPMAKRAGSVLAVDIEPKMIDLLNKRIVERKAGNVKAVKADISVVPVAAESVSHILAAFVYHEVPNQKDLIRECARVLAPSGSLTIVDFQKRETAFGPPLSVRKTPEHVQRTAGKWFSPRARFETDVYYQIEFTKK